MAEQPASVDAALWDAERAMAEFDRVTLAVTEAKARLEEARGDPGARARAEGPCKEACLEAARAAAALGESLVILRDRMEAVYRRVGELQSDLLSRIGKPDPPGGPGAT